MWPEKRDLEIVFKSDIAFAIHHLKKLIKEHNVKEGESRKTAFDRFREIAIFGPSPYSRTAYAISHGDFCIF